MYCLGSLSLFSSTLFPSTVEAVFIKKAIINLLYATCPAQNNRQTKLELLERIFDFIRWTQTWLCWVWKHLYKMIICQCCCLQLIFLYSAARQNATFLTGTKTLPSVQWFTVYCCATVRMNQEVKPVWTTSEQPTFQSV